MFAECGGLMFLTKEINQQNGEKFPMLGVFHCSTQMTNALQRFGYAILNYANDQTRCHEFYRSELVNI